MDFFVTLTSVLMALFYMIPGFLLRKFHLANENHLKTLSSILIYICGPAMVINSFWNISFSLQILQKMGLFFIISLLIQLIAILILYFFFRRKYDDASYRIITIGSIFGNVGFFGMPLISSLVTDRIAMCYSAMYVFSMNILVFTIGVFAITKDKKYISIKSAIINPTSISIILILPFFILNLTPPKALNDGIALLGNMTMPVCMLILGIRLASLNLVDLFKRKMVYLAIIIKLVLFPLFAFFLVYFLPLDNVFKASILVLSSVPSASIVLNLAEIHGKDQELSANIILLSTILSVVSIPLVLLIL